MSPKKLRIVLLAASLTLTGAGSYLAYQRTARSAPPQFDRGGTWAASPGLARASDATSSPGGTLRPAAASTGSPGSKLTAASASPDGRRTDGTVYPRPRQGTYRFVTSGEERVRFGSFSPCGWSLEEETVVVHEEVEGTVFDRAFHQNHSERAIYRYGPREVLLTYVGAKVTCSVAPPQTTDGAYEPPLVRFRFPFAAGRTWQGRTTTDQRTETYMVTVLRRERVTVPAGIFDAWAVRFEATFSGTQSGEHTDTVWYVPELGFWVKQQSRTEAKQGSTTYTSSYTSSLASYPS